MHPITVRSIFILAVGLSIAACDQAPEEQVTATVPAATPVTGPDIYQIAVAEPGRPETDLIRDADRRPAEVLRFFGIQPGMQVLDMFAGGGYYTELCSSLLGPDGRVVMYNNQAYIDFTQAEQDARFADGRLANVEFLTQEVADLELEAGRFDAALFILAYHDVYYVNEPSWPAIDAAALLAEVHRSLRPGGIVGVVDHAAEDQAGTTVAQSLHRIARAALVADFEAAGFVLEAESDLLAHPEDDLGQLVFADGVRGITDRFVLRFRRP